jgi:RHS repeat-associated protein
MHEHLDDFGLINMNGRAYDPLLARFLSPDPFIQAPDNWGSFNRYGYCMNNPLMYTDPSGEIIFTLLSAFLCPALLPYAISADISWMSEYASQVMTNYSQAQASGNKFSHSDMWLGKIDWFDVGANAVSGGVSIVPGFQWVNYATPFVTNALDIKGNGEVNSIFGGYSGGKTINFGEYLGNSVLEGTAIAGTYVLKNTLGKNVTKEIIGKLPSKTLQGMAKKELLSIASKEILGNLSYDALGAYFGKLSQSGFSDEYQRRFPSNQLEEGFL